MKRAVAALLLIALLLPMTLAGCGPDRGQGSVVCRQFIQYLAEQNFDAAYNLIAPDLQKEEPPETAKPTKAPTPGPGETAVPTAEPTSTPLPTAEPTAEPAGNTNHRMTRTEFKKKYTDIFEAMELTAITSQIISEVNGTLTASVVYRMAYLTNKAGNLIFDFTVNSEYHEGWVVMWDPSLIFPNMEWGDTMLVGTNYPDRGEIFDAEGILLAENVPAVTIYCIPSKIQLKDGGKAVTDVKTLFKAEDKQLSPDQLLEKELYVPFEQAVAAVPELGMTEADVRNSLARTFRDFAKLKVLYPDQMSPELEARLLTIPGVGVDSNNYGTLRQYPYGTSLAHLLGYAGIIQKEYLNHYSMENGILKENKEWLYVIDPETGERVNDPNYDGDSWLGYAGLEKQYEERLRGVKGSFAYIQGAGGKVKQILYNIPPVDGEDLHLTVKIDLQKRTEEVIKTIVYDDSISGTVLVMNPTTGGVEAMVSFPGYDPNSFSRGDLDDEAWSAMEKDPKTPLLNRAIQGLYPPGSTFKPLVAITALESGAVTLDWAFPEEAERLKGTDTIWNPTKGTLIPESGVTKVTRTYSTNRRGPMNMKNCMIQSDNIYFAYLGMKIGWDTLKKYLTIMGMGEAVPFDLPTQKSQIKNTGTDKEPASEETMDLLAMTGYGQGELLLTPLQLASYISAFRNGGTVYEPYVIESIWQEEGTEYVEVEHHEETVWKDICATSTAASILDMLEGVVEAPSNMGKNPVTTQNWGGYGTGRFLSVLRTYTCAGKTGTAELAKKQNAKDADKELAWFVAFRSRHIDGTELKPEEERLVLVMLEIDMTKQVDEWTQMKFLIAQVLLKDDTLTVPPKSESCIENSGSDAPVENTSSEPEEGDGNTAG